MNQVGKRSPASGHVHLAVVDPATPVLKPRWDWARWPVLFAGVVSASLFAASFFAPWWRFWLYAPQYPKGLTLVISLTGMGGDVSEIDLLNHYIGMSHLAGAAPIERHLAGYGVAAISVLVVVLFACSGRRLNRLIAVPAMLFPVTFLVDSFYWLYTFGHRLDPRAPLHIGVFTPQLFGNGKIGQFETFARPDFGFWLAIAGVACAVVAALVRSRVCANCPDRGTCNGICPRLMIMPGRTQEHDDEREKEPAE